MAVALMIVGTLIALVLLKLAHRFWFKAKCLHVINNDFLYRPSIPGGHTEIFNAAHRESSARGGNEYDVAIMFMLVLLSALLEPLDSEARHFFDKKMRVIEKAIPKSVNGQSMMSEFLGSRNLRSPLQAE